MAFKYEFKGIYNGKNNKLLKFPIHKFDDGKYLKKNMAWENDNPYTSVNTLQSTFNGLHKQNPPILTIAKKSDSRIDQIIAKDAAESGVDADFAIFTIIFTAYLNGGFLARQKLELLNPVIIGKTSTRIKGLGNLTVFTFQADNTTHSVISEDEYHNSLGD
jgi:hypothetical protein